MEFTDMQAESVWIRFAGDRRAWKGKNGTSYRWRVFIGRSRKPTYLKSMRLVGMASARNNKTGWRKAPDSQGVIAWTSYFGDIEVRDGVATISLKEPK